MGLEERDEQDLADEALVDVDEEAAVDEFDDSPLASAGGLGPELSEADALDQRREVPLDDDR